MAEGVGFEPTVRLHAQRFSRPSPSSSRPPLHFAKCKLNPVQVILEWAIAIVSGLNVIDVY